MTKQYVLMSAFVSTFLAASALAGNHDPSVIAPLLKDAKLTLAEGIDFAEKLSGVATSAKFEVSDEGKLELSVYTIPEGLGVEPEKASLTEVSGVVTEAPFAAHVAVFEDKEHIARASVHMTLFQLSRFTLKQVIGRALAVHSGIPIDVRNPIVRDRRPVADVILIDSYDRTASTVTVDLLSGRATLKKAGGKLILRLAGLARR